ncbi:MAG: 4Fe-4S dicluster domain-containing protein [Gammaproteobacteria bacterium]|nr:4Fe-4S dicluster domain-containing protein [Gammaproteobacteria bacterium]
MNNPEQLDVSVWRGTGESGEFKLYSVPSFESQTVLDIVSWIQLNVDPTLSYRFACRVGMCVSCAMMVNGQPRWTCRTHVSKVLQGNRLEVGPLRNLPVIKDLATDMDPFFGKWIEAQGWHESGLTRHDDIPCVDPQSETRSEADDGIECINCAVCYAACDTVTHHPEYLGPAALQRAWTVYNDEKNTNKARVLQAVSGSNGCHNCHSMGSCTQHCPNELNPMKAIAGFKKETLKTFWKRTKHA